MIRTTSASDSRRRNQKNKVRTHTYEAETEETAHESLCKRGKRITRGNSKQQLAI